MGNKALTGAELEVTQRIQTHFPRGLNPEILARVNSCPAEKLRGAIMKMLESFDEVNHFPDVLLGRAKMKPIRYAVDFGADPFIPNNWSVEEHHGGEVAKLKKKDDVLYLDGKKVEFWLSDEQKGDSVIGNILRAELKGKPVLNANLLDYLLKNSHLIPEVWKKDENGNTHYILFWGTIYRDANDNLCVRYLYWRDGRWYWNYVCLHRDFSNLHPAAVLAS